MEAKINIAAILKDKPQGIRLYSPIFGECAFCSVQNITDSISVKKHNGEEELFNSKGLYCTLGEVMLYPSKEMRDWSKITWKKGDVLVSNDDDSHIIFNGFSKDDYTTFEGEHYVGLSERRYIFYLSMQNTQGYHIEYDKDAAQTYINTIEKRLGGKLNRETLKIEKAQPEFKDGDIVVTDAIPSLWYSKCIFILKGNLNTGESRANSYIFYNINNNHISFDILDTIIKERNIHLATEEEKKQLFKALANEGKDWDADKKEVIALKPLWTPKAFDKVLVKDETYESWKPALFWKRVDAQDLHPYMIIGGKRYRYCEPYEGNENLLDD